MFINLYYTTFLVVKPLLVLQLFSLCKVINLSFVFFIRNITYFMFATMIMLFLNKILTTFLQLAQPTLKKHQRWPLLRWWQSLYHVSCSSSSSVSCLCTAAVARCKQRRAVERTMRWKAPRKLLWRCSLKLPILET